PLVFRLPLWARAVKRTEDRGSDNAGTDPRPTPDQAPNLAGPSPDRVQGSNVHRGARGDVARVAWDLCTPGAPERTFPPSVRRVSTRHSCRAPARATDDTTPPSKRVADAPPASKIHHENTEAGRRTAQVDAP